jgi:hypothetical protein
MSFSFLYILNSLPSSLTVYILPSSSKQEWQKSPARTRQTDGKNLVWVGEMERNLPNYQRLLLLTVLPLNYFMDFLHSTTQGPTLCVHVGHTEPEGNIKNTDPCFMSAKGIAAYSLK